MQNKIKLLVVGAILMFSWALAGSLYALPQNYKKTDDTEQLQAESKRIQQLYDVRKNTVSNIQFYTSNYGIFGFDVARSRGAGYWPRGSLNQYIFAGGIWFGAQKLHPDSTGQLAPKKYVSLTYNPNSAQSWMVPGRIFDYNGNEQLLANEDDVWLYRTYISTEFNRSTGKPYNAEEKYAWPIWDTESKDSGYVLKYDRYFGKFVNNPADRNTDKYKKGPAFVSEEDIFASFKDTDLNKYQIGAGKAREDGYPLKMQYEQMIYSWGFGEYKDFIFIKYDIISMSKDTLRNCWMAPIMDVDIARSPYTDAGAQNDRVKYYKPKDWEDQPDKKSVQDTLNLAFQWTMNNQGEDGKGFGYLGYDFLESPSVHKAVGEVEVIENDKKVMKNWMWSTFHEVKKGQYLPNSNQRAENDTIIGITKLVYDKALEGFVRKDKRYYETIEQLGLVSFRNWNISEDKHTADEQYNFLSDIGPNGYYRDGDTGPGDKRFMMATGPFSMLPKDTVRVVVGIILALPAVQREADGSEEDVANLKRRDMFAQKVYDNHFRAPAPPENTRFLGYKSYNNAIEVYWDSTAEMSYDPEERGLDFMGYTLYRARDPLLDTFNVNKVQADDKYAKGRGPFGWKRVESWQMPSPYIQTGIMPTPGDNKIYPSIDDFEIVGLGFEGDKMDTMSITIMKRPMGFVTISAKDRATMNDTAKYATPTIHGFYPDTNNPNPWVKYLMKFWDNNLKDVQLDPLKSYKAQYPNNVFLDNILMAKVVLNQALVSYNPLFYVEETVPAYGYMQEKLKDQQGKDSLGALTRIDLTPENMKDEALQKKLVSQYRANPEDGYYIFLYNTFRPIEINGNVKYYLTRMKPLWNTKPESWANIFKNEEWLRYAKGKFIEFMQKGMVNDVIINDSLVYDAGRAAVIEPYMTKITNGRKYYDFADDGNNNKVVETSDNSALTERILNNIDYYYKLEAYDEGDYLQPTESKKNDGSKGRSNNILAYAKAGRPDDNVEIEITKVDSELMGGLRNFKFFTIDPDRLNQKLAGKSLKLKLEPYSYISKVSVPGKTGKQSESKDIAFYQTKFTLTDSATNEVLFNSVIRYTDGQTDSYMNLLTENGFTVLMSDTVLDKVSNVMSEFGKPENTDKFIKRGSYTTGRFNVPGYSESYAFTNGYENIFGFSFDYGFEQHGGVIRSHSIEKVNNKNASTIVSTLKNRSLTHDPNKFGDQWDYAGTQITDVRASLNNYQSAPMYMAFPKGVGFLPAKSGVPKQYNLGPADYQITFKEGGRENITVSYNNSEPETSTEVTFDVPYLTYEVKNVYNVDIQYPNSKETVKYGFNYEPMVLPETMNWEPFTGVVSSVNDKGEEVLTTRKVDMAKAFPHPSNLKSDATNFMGKFNTFAVAYVNSRNKALGRPQDYKNTIAVEKGKSYINDAPNIIGKQNRYYMSATNGDATIDFVNVLDISGAFFFLDYAQMGRFIKKAEEFHWEVPNADQKQYGEDFKAGDQLLAKVRGGVFGLPMAGAEVHAKVKPIVSDNYTASQLSRVKVVPNPYYISHEAQKSAYDTKLYFTKLPKECNIDIFTINGDLVRSIKHAPTEKDDDFNSGESHTEFSSYKFAMEPWDLYSSNNQRVQSQTFIALITTPNGEKQTVRFSVLVGSTRLVTD